MGWNNDKKTRPIVVFHPMGRGILKNGEQKTYVSQGGPPPSGVALIAFFSKTFYIYDSTPQGIWQF